MKRVIAAGVLLLSAAVFQRQPSSESSNRPSESLSEARQGTKQSNASVQTDRFSPADQIGPELQYDAVDPIKMPPDMYLGEITSVALNSKGHIFLFSRTNPNGSATVFGERGAQVFEFAPDGKFIREIGRNLYSMAWGHSVRIDKQDNIWLVDRGSSMIVKLSPDLKVQFTLGRRTAGAIPPPVTNPPPPPRTVFFNNPTDVAFDAAGNIYVSDGYVNAQVAKFDSDGHYLKAWGEHGTGPGQFQVPHGIAVDDSGIVYVVDRSNGRIQVFDSEGKYLREYRVNVTFPKDYVPPIPSPGAKDYSANWPDDICITPGPGTQYLYVTDMLPGRIYKMSLDGKVLGHFGTAGHKIGQFGWVHGIYCRSENEVWVGEELNWRTQKITVHPERSKSPGPVSSR